ncbi:MAG: hypothetical protein DRN71_05965 [Candidatus Nanohalarchaeota archaeon]|nr:MAG: hypothetical protein DRN71_05965 [Candidatus Nanohaloarchaeota archaeon]
MTKVIKKPWLAAILNLLLSGLGYVYVGKRVGFGIALVLWGVILFAMMSSQQIPPMMWLDSFVLSILFAYDGYKTAQEVNMNK